MKYLVLIESKWGDTVVCYAKDKLFAEKAADKMLKDWREKHGTLNDTRLVISEVIYCIEG